MPSFNVLEAVFQKRFIDEEGFERFRLQKYAIRAATIPPQVSHAEPLMEIKRIVAGPLDEKLYLIMRVFSDNRIGFFVQKVNGHGDILDESFVDPVYPMTFNDWFDGTVENRKRALQSSISTVKSW